MKGVGITRITLQMISNWCIPLPPVNEQKKIADEIEKWFCLIDEIESDKIDLIHLITKIKSAILAHAIQGKLVEQDSSDEPASDMLKRINPDWQPCDTSHYPNLPNGWTICKLEDVVDYEQPQNYIVSSTDYSDEYPIPVLTAGKSFIIGYTNETFGIQTNIPVIIFDDFTTESKYVDFPFKVKSSAMKILHVKDGVNIRFIHLIMSVTKLIGDTHKRYWISEYSQLPILLPPVVEQDRIVQVVDNYFEKLDEIERLIQ